MNLDDVEKYLHAVKTDEEGSFIFIRYFPENKSSYLKVNGLSAVHIFGLLQQASYDVNTKRVENEPPTDK